MHLQLCTAAFPVFACVTIAACHRGAPPEDAPLVVAAAVSLKAPLEDLAARYTGGGAGKPHVVFSFGASGDLAQQIAQGSPAALFASAAEAPAHALETSGALTRSCVLATGALALVRRDTPELANLRWETLAHDPAVLRVALGLTPVVPAGVYAEEALTKLGILSALAPKIVRGANARNVLDMVLRGEADAAIVYATDASAFVQPDGGRAVIVGPPPASAAPRIEYSLGVVRGAPAAASDLAHFLCAPEASEAFLSRGFGPR